MNQGTRIEVFGVTESSVTLSIGVGSRGGEARAPVTLRLDGRARVPIADSADSGPAPLVRIEGLAPDREYTVQLEIGGHRGLHVVRRVRTLPAPTARLVGCFATIDDPHVGAPSLAVSGTAHDPGGEARRARRAFVAEDAVAEINALGADLTVVKGDLTHDGTAEQLVHARRILGRLRSPWQAILGNHDVQGGADAYALLGQRPAPRVVELAGWRLILLDTARDGTRRGELGDGVLRWLAKALAERPEAPTLVLMHHQAVLRPAAHGLPDTIGLSPETSMRLLETLRGHPQVRAVLSGHTHRNHVQWHPRLPSVPFVEVAAAKDFPGVFAHYRLYADGSFRQEVRRITTPRALAHADVCEAILGPYRQILLGPLEARSFHLPPLKHGRQPLAGDAT